MEKEKAKYQVKEQLFEGTRGKVFRAVTVFDKTPVIIKNLNPEFSTLRDLAELRHEYETARGLKLPGVVNPLALDRLDEQPALILEDFGGTSLQKFLKSQTISVELFLKLAVTLANTLGEIHSKKIIHNDINPENIILNMETGVTKITDFGIAAATSGGKHRLYNPEAIEGTLTYISPEQTGRMNRTVDHRTDFYSLGVTFYEMLLGRVPFDFSDPLELIHAHIAKRPTAPSQLNKTIPEAISQIILKLLSKTAEERYKSAFGLKADLEACVVLQKERRDSTPFTPGAFDVSDSFEIPEKIYGREKEIEILLSTFSKVSTGQSAVLMVSGYAGSGKSVLVNEIHRPVVRQKGYFISGKFEQFQRDIPYASLIQAFRSLIKQLLTESRDRIENWRRALRDALGSNGQVIVDVIPEVELLMGKQVPIPHLPPEQSQNRFNLCFQKFIGVFTQPKHPLVLFLDDLQWADSGSLNLLTMLMTDADQKYLYVIGSYRDNEVDEINPLKTCLKSIKAGGGAFGEITVTGLTAKNILDLICDSLGCTRKTGAPLAELVLQKTYGNPFFVREFLKTLYQENLFEFDFSDGWKWEIEQIKHINITDNVVELMAAKIKKLPEKTQKALQLAACIGNVFDLKILALATETKQVELAGWLSRATEEGLILPLGTGYRFFETLRKKKGAHGLFGKSGYLLQILPRQGSGCRLFPDTPHRKE